MTPTQGWLVCAALFMIASTCYERCAQEEHNPNSLRWLAPFVPDILWVICIISASIQYGKEIRGGQ